LEAALLVQVFDWTNDEILSVCALLEQSLKAPNPFKPDLVGTGRLQRVAIGVNAIREAMLGCSQAWWPVRPEEYALSLLCALLPITRYWTEIARKRATALLMSAVVAKWLVDRFQESR
jgi:hypothetical protein